VWPTVSSSTTLVILTRPIVQCIRHFLCNNRRAELDGATGAVVNA
jgi:hypothetical protein